MGTLPSIPGPDAEEGRKEGAWLSLVARVQEPQVTP